MSADGSVVIGVDLSISEAQKEIARLKRKILDLDESIGTAGTRKNALLDSLKQAQEELAKIQSQTQIQGDKFIITPENVARITELKGKISEIEAQIEKCDEAISNGNINLQYMKERYGAIEAESIGLSGNAESAANGLDDAADSGNGLADSLAAAGDRMKKFERRVFSLVKRVFVFSVITSALRAMRTYLGNVIKTNAEAQASLSRLKGALLTLAQPIIGVLVPALTTLLNLLAKLASIAARIVSTLFGTTVGQSAKAAENLYDEQQALEGVGAAAEEAAGSLAGFDEINTIQTENKTGGGGGAAAEGTKPDFSSVIGSSLDAIVELFSGLALLALGAILTFSGVNIPLGIALMALGAAFLVDAIATNWGAISEALQGSLGVALAIISGALLVVGAILAFSGAKIPLGIALMAIGAIGLASVVAANWDSLSQVLQGPIGTITAILSGALLVIGALLAFSGANIPLGLGLMAAGAAGLAAVLVANWDTISTALQGPIGDIVSLVSVALLVLGAILLFSGAAVPLGLGLLAVGAAGLAATIAANWDTVQGYLEGPTGAVTALISGSLLAVGAVLLFSGANVPLGLGLLAVGAVGLATSTAANWETIQDALTGPVGTVTALISGAVLMLGAILAFSGVALPLGIALMAAGAVGIVAATAANWDTITDALRGPVGAVTAIISAALLVLGAVLLFTGAGVPLGLGLILAGSAGLAATIAPNWNFILEKIKGAWENVKSWWKGNVSELLTWEYWSNLGESMIDGLLAGLEGIFSGLSSWASNVWSTITGVFSGKNAKSGISNSAGGVKTRTINIADIPPVESFKIPALARGAVIPPNREFMAVLGDQRSGNNIEAPEDLIRKIVREENGNAEMIALLRQILSATKAKQKMYVNQRVLAETAKDGINDMTRQAGRSVLLY